MDKVFYILSTLFILVMVWLLQEEFQSWDQQRQLLKNANNQAVHTALQSTDDFNEGLIDLSPTAAQAAYLQALKKNLGLDDQLAPRSGSPVRSTIRLVHFEVIDSYDHTFPFVFENQNYHITKYLRGPAVFAVIEMDYPLLMNRPRPDPIRVPSIFEYAAAS
jgi:hypothetical protein